MISLEDKRSIFRLWYAQGQSQREISKSIHKNRRTVKKVIDEVELKISELSLRRDQILTCEDQLITQGTYPTTNRTRYKMSDAFFSELHHELKLRQDLIDSGRKPEAQRISEIYAVLSKHYSFDTVEEYSAYKLARQIKEKLKLNNKKK